MLRRFLMLLAALCLCCVAAAAEGEADITYQDKLPDAPQAALYAAMAAIHQPYTLEYACGFREPAVESGEITVIHAQLRLTATGGLHVAVLRGNQGKWRLCALSCVLPVRDGKQPTVRHQEAWQFSVEYADAAFTFGENNDGEWVLERYEVLGFRDAEPLRVDCFAGPYEMTLEWCDWQLQCRHEHHDPRRAAAYTRTRAESRQRRRQRHGLQPRLGGTPASAHAA